jgi:hypothetical protein
LDGVTSFHWPISSGSGGETDPAELLLDVLLLELLLDELIELALLLETLLRLELTLDTLLLEFIMLDELDALTTLDILLLLMLLALLLEIEPGLEAELTLDAELILELLLTPTPGALLLAATSLPPVHPCNNNDAISALSHAGLTPHQMMFNGFEICNFIATDSLDTKPKVDWDEVSRAKNLADNLMNKAGRAQHRKPCSYRPERTTDRKCSK